MFEKKNLLFFYYHFIYTLNIPRADKALLGEGRCWCLFKLDATEAAGDGQEKGEWQFKIVFKV